MKKELITTLTDNFELHAQQTDGEVEYWLARDLQHLLGYYVKVPQGQDKSPHRMR